MIPSRAPARSGTETSISWLKYVRLSDVGTYLAKGWTIRNDMATDHHGEHAVLMIFVGEGDPQ